MCFLHLKVFPWDDGLLQKGGSCSEDVGRPVRVCNPNSGSLTLLSSRSASCDAYRVGLPQSSANQGEGGLLGLLSLQRWSAQIKFNVAGRRGKGVPLGWVSLSPSPSPSTSLSQERSKSNWKFRSMVVKRPLKIGSFRDWMLHYFFLDKPAKRGAFWKDADIWFCFVNYLPDVG